MKLDSTATTFLAEIQQEILEEENVELSIQEIGEIAGSQFIGANYAFKKGVEVRLPGFGSFIRKHGKKKMDDTVIFKETHAHLDKEEYEKAFKEFKIKTAQASKVRPDKMTLKELRDTKDIVNIKSRYDL